MAKRGKPGTSAPDRQSSAFQASARDYAREALDMLFALAKDAESEAVRVSAIKELLDRGFGKSGALAGGDAPPILTRIERVIVSPED